MTLIVAANLPDVDALSYLAGADAALGLRRGLTHSVVAMALLPIALAGAVTFFDRRWRRRRPQAPAASFARLLPLAYLGVASHLLLDWLNTYGIRLLMPFDQRWFYGDALFIIDPWLWLCLGGSVFLRHGHSRRGLLAWAALAVVTTTVFFAGSVGRPGARALWISGLLILLTLRSAARLTPIDRRRRARLAAAALLAASLYVTILYSGSRLIRTKRCWSR